jgi:hypothetical protein
MPTKSFALRFMSRRAVVVVIASLGAIVLANGIVLAFWLPRHMNSSSNANAASPPSALVQAPPAQSAAPGAATSGTGQAKVGSAPAAAPGGDFAVERQVASASGNLRIKYLRDHKTKTRRLIVEDAQRPESSAILFEGKGNAWLVVSPDDQWIALDQRTGTDGGGARLYHRAAGAAMRYDLAGEADLQEAIWKVYLNATHGDVNTPRRGVTIDATAWENDSRKLNVSVAYLPRPQQPDVPEPWSCTYDVVSKQVEPLPDQPSVEPGNGEISAADSGAAEGAVAEGPMSADERAHQENANEVADADLPGERFPATRSEELTVPDVNESSLDDITYAINEMFARHGIDFKDKKVTQQFSEFPWYEPRPGLTYDQAEQEFSDLEKQNLKVLTRCRDAKLAATRRKSNPGRGQRAEDESTAEKVMRGIRTWQDLGGPMPPHP